MSTSTMWLLLFVVVALALLVAALTKTKFTVQKISIIGVMAALSLVASAFRVGGQAGGDDAGRSGHLRLCDSDRASGAGRRAAVPGMDRRGDPLRRHYVAVAAQEAGPRVRRGDRSAHAQVRRYDVPHLALVRPKYQIGHAGAVRHPAHFGLVRRLPLCGGRPAAVMPPLRSN